MLPFESVSDTLRQLDAEVGWSILLFQEFLSLRKPREDMSFDGHYTLCSPSIGGARQVGLVLHRDSTFNVLKELRLHRAVGVLASHPHYGKIILGTVHLDPYRKKLRYRECLN